MSFVLQKRFLLLMMRLLLFSNMFDRSSSDKSSSYCRVQMIARSSIDIEYCFI